MNFHRWATHFFILDAMEDVVIFAYFLTPEIKVSVAHCCVKCRCWAIEEKIATGRCDYMACKMLKGGKYAYF